MMRGFMAAGKAECKAALQRELGLPEDPSMPLLGFIGRLDFQKVTDGTTVTATIASSIRLLTSFSSCTGFGIPSAAWPSHGRWTLLSVGQPDVG